MFILLNPCSRGQRSINRWTSLKWIVIIMLLAIQFSYPQWFTNETPQRKTKYRNKSIVSARKFRSGKCDYTYELSEQELPLITSPGYPGTYPPHADCRWTLKAPYGKRILLTFQKFRLQTSLLIWDCTSDFLEIIDIVVRKTKYCGLRPPEGNFFYSIGPYLVVRFVSDFRFEYEGFAFQVDIRNVTDCALTKKNEMSGSFTHPLQIQQPALSSSGRPMEYVCAWKLEGPPGTKIKMRCEKFIVPSSFQCILSNLIVNIRGDNTMQNVNSYCGTKYPPPAEMISIGWKMNVMFYSTQEDKIPLFNCEYIFEGPKRRGMRRLSTAPTCGCGLMSPRQFEKLEGIEHATNDPHPLVVIIHSVWGSVICQGTLISRLFVLTSASCTERILDEYTMVVLEDFHSTEPRLNRAVPTEKIIIHPMYKKQNKNSSEYDIALIKIKETEFLDGQHIACVPPADLDLSRHKAELYAVTYNTSNNNGESGSDNFTTYPPGKYLKYQFPVINYNICKEAFIGISSQHFCAGEPGKYPDKTDIGAGIYTEHENRQTIIGIVGLNNVLVGPDKPSIFTRVSSFISWIKEHISCI